MVRKEHVWEELDEGAYTADGGGRHTGLHQDDFVFVAPSTASRLPLAFASRYWRKGMRAAFIMDQPQTQLPQELTADTPKFHERFAHYPDFKTMANKKRDHYLKGDRRAAMAPILAYAALAPGQAGMPPWAVPTRLEQAAPAKDPFKWMLAGDDDTVFFMHGMKHLLKDYDPQLPYFLSDSMYIGSKSPQPGVWSMRCYPCHLEWNRWRRARASARRRMLAGPPPKCECSTEFLCKTRFKGNESACMNEWEGPVPWGGVGFIFSIGFFKKLAALNNGNGLKAYEDCVNHPNTSVMSFPEGGDAFMSRCLWRLGFPVTDIGYPKYGRYQGELLNTDLMFQVPANLTKGRMPSAEIQTRWTQGISLHLGARQMKSFRHAALTVKYIMGVYDMVAELMWPLGRPK